MPTSKALPLATSARVVAPPRRSERLAPPFMLFEAPADPRAFETTLRRYCATTTGEVVVELCAVRLDGESVRALARTRRQLRLVGRRLVVRGPIDGGPATGTPASGDGPSTTGRAAAACS